MGLELPPFLRRVVISILMRDKNGNTGNTGIFQPYKERLLCFLVVWTRLKRPRLSYVDRPQDSGTQCLSGGLDWKESVLV